MNKDMLDFPETSDYTKSDVKRVQERLLEMAKVTCSILEQNGFHYILALGTLLGAVRHKGFIPWDDDFDIFLFDDEYEAAMICLKENLPDEMKVHDRTTDPTYYADWAKIRDLKSEVHNEAYPVDGEHKYKGLWLDLYKLKRVKRIELEEHRKREHIQFLVRKHDVGFLSDDEFKSKFSEWCEEFVNFRNSHKDDKFETDDIYAFVVFIKYLELEEVWPLKQYEFEDTKFWGPNNYDAILKRSYNDYMRVPEFEKRKPHCGKVVYFE